jgi:hypothetical protein
MGLAKLAILLVVSLAPDSAADEVTLKDGSVVRGQVVDSNDRGKLIFIVRRAWAEAELPERARAWRAAEAPWMKRARSERRARLEAWRRDRKAALDADAARTDTILRWLDSEVDALAKADEDDLPQLMMTAIGRAEVKSVERRPQATSRLLRMGWKARFDDVESMKVDDLKSALEGRNFPVEGDDPATIDDLLPTPIESDARWLSRRAATEVVHDAGLRFIRHGNLVLPEGNAGAALGDLGGLSDLVGSVLGEPQAGDPLAPKLRALGEKGRVGAVLTRLEIAPDLAGVRVESVFLVRLGPERWQPAATRSASVRTDELRADAGANIAADPQVQSVFSLFEGLGLGEVSPEMKQRSVAIGAATQQALGRARSGLQEELEALTLPVGAPRP